MFYQDKNTQEIFKTRIDFISNCKNPHNVKFVIDDFWLTNKWYNPKESFLELLKQRALQLRNSYKYLILYYSGGSDSATVLQTFINNNIPLDEIVINRMSINNINPLLDVELAITNLKAMKLQTKITINEINEEVMTDFFTNQKWITSHFNGTLGNFRRFPLHVLDQFGYVNFNISDVAHIYAEAKPQLEYRDNKWFTGMSPEIFIVYHPNTVLFYTDTAFPKLQYKQTYLVKEFFEKYKHNTYFRIVNEGQTTEIRNDLIRACRLSFDNRYQPAKRLGLLRDFKSPHPTEDSIVIDFIAKSSPKLYDIYYNSTVKSYAKINKSKALDIYRADFYRPQTEFIIPL